MLRSVLLRTGGEGVIDAAARGSWRELGAKLRTFVARRVRSTGHQAGDAVGARVHRSRDGRTRLYVDGGRGRTELAEVTRSAMGTRDDRGDFRALVSDATLSDMGIGYPPYHGLCRTTTLAVV